MIPKPPEADDADSRSHKFHLPLWAALSIVGGPGLGILSGCVTALYVWADSDQYGTPGFYSIAIVSILGLIIGTSSAIVAIISNLVADSIAPKRWLRVLAVSLGAGVGGAFGYGLTSAGVSDVPMGYVICSLLPALLLGATAALNSRSRFRSNN